MKKTCTTCKEEKNIQEFRRDRSRKDGYQSSCKICSREKHKSLYSQKYSVKYNIRNNERRIKHLNLINEYKKNLSCVKCGEQENICLEFHHLNPEKKEFTIGSAVSRSWDVIEKELQKCVILCSNCHKKVHAKILDL